MISLRKTVHFLISFSLMLFISTASSFIARDALATPLFTVTVGQWGQSSGLLAWGFGNVEETAKDLKGKAQEFAGNVTGDPKDQVMGKGKQIQSRVQNAAQTAKDSMKNGRDQAIAKNLEGKLQETKGNITNNPGDQMMGKVKQAESQVRNTVEDVKSAAQDLIN